MRVSNSRINALLLGLLPFAVCVTARADDTEIFNVSTLNAGAPNVMFILDTSGSMGSTVIKSDPYDPLTTYTGSCTSGSIYYTTTGTPTCTSKTIAPASLVCAAANKALFTNGASSGIYNGNAIRWLTTETKTSATSTTKTTSQKYNVTYSTTQPAVQPWKKTGSTWKTNGALVLGSPVSTGPETSTATGGVTNGNTTATAPATTDTFTYAWTTPFAAPANTSSSGTASSTGASSSTVTATTTPTVASTSTTAIDPVPTGGASGATANQRVTYTVNYKRTDTILTNTGNTTTTTSTQKLYTVGDIECDGDSATPGTPSLGYPNVVSVNVASDQYTTTKTKSYWDNNGGLLKYNMYSGNYINYKANPPGTNQGTRLQVVQQSANNLLDNLTGVNVGLMRYSDNVLGGDQTASGGMVMSPIVPVDTGSNRSDIKNMINAFTANGNTPLSETLFEAYRYYSGGSVLFGVNSKAIVGGVRRSVPSVASSRVGGTLASSVYQSPINASCQTNYIVYLTDGLPTADGEVNTLIPALPSEATLGGACDAASGDGVCLGALAQYMYNADLSGSQVGTQKVATYFVGFGSDFVTNGQLNTAFTYLQAAALRGGGRAYQAGDLTELDKTLSDIFLDIGTRNVSFVAPTVAVDAFNRSQTLNDLFFSVFQPSLTAHWPGNVKKYHFQQNEIRDKNGAAAVDTSGFFKHAAQSYWSAAADGESVVEGGAASRIPDPSGTPARTIYTYIGSNPGVGPGVDGTDLTTSSNYLVDTSNTLLTTARLNIGGTGDPSINTLISWARGLDTNDDNKDSNRNDTRHVMGDPIHSRPSAVIYGGTEANPDIVLFAATNDGYLHAIGGTDGDGKELWAFIPQEFLGGLKTIYNDAATSPKRYTLDGDIVVVKYDANSNGIVDSGDKVIIVFGEARGGNRYHALDVTDRNKPKYLWTIGATQLPGLGQTWSTPSYMRVKVAGATQNSQQLALFIGGGYDAAEDSPGYQATDGSGNHVYIVDALYGTLLWSDANLALAQPGHAMDHAIPSAISVVDVDSDSYADRFYVGDMAGQIWRFDITNGNTASTLVAGGVIASLGSHDESTHLAINNRRFYYPPSVAFVQPPRAPAFFNIGIGSGYRGHPLDAVTQDRFYSVRDYKPNAAMTQADYNAFAVATDASLTDVTTRATKPSKTATGWKMFLNQYGGWDGEKILSTARTLDNTIYFQSYTPNTSTTPSATSCAQTSIGTNLSYRVNLLDGNIVDSSQSVPYTKLEQSGIAPEVVFLFGKEKDGSDSGILINTEVQKCKGCSNDKGKTYWRSSDSE